ncbi:phosphotransferase family protein [Blastococcus sp. PRF04-17]|uniref:phosphotransferase family protein n=1 Tax=Blastococcus sp. PRF04-17 TaxID=2933797 RepID=UPI001FF11F29|nr:phosphotransferase [Blastococcus sp. PRF04-17]UOY03091.1 phosphotransferase [Blastococcus sp. PRF04-17]
MPPRELQDLIRSLVAAELGSGSRLLDVATLQESSRGVVLRLEVSGSPGPLVLTLTGADHARTAAVVGLARAAGVPVPDVVAVGDGYLLRAHVEGTEWHRLRPQLDHDAVRAVHRRFAETLLAIQSVTMASFGELDHQGSPAGHSQVEALHRRADLRIEDAASRDLFHAVLDRDADLYAAGRPTLVHDDLHHGNVLLGQEAGEWRVTGVLDWEKAWAGPSESDVARMAFWDGMTGPGFWQVYRAAVPADDGYARRALVHQLLWCLEYDDGTARHARDTAAVRAALGIASD